MSWTKNAWTFSKPDPALKMRFNAMVSVEFYAVSQETKLFVPSLPDLVKPLRSDTLYPFYLFGSQDQFNSLN